MTDMQLHNSMESRDSQGGLGTGRDVAEPLANLTSTDSSPTLARISETLDALASLLQSELPQVGDGASVGSTPNLVAIFDQRIEELRNQLTAIRTEDGPWRQKWLSKFSSSESTQSYAALLAELEETRRQLGEAKAASEACKDDSQQLADTLLEKTNEAVLVLNDKTCVSCNEKALLLLSCDRRHVIGRWPSPFSPQRLAGGEESAYQLVDMHRNALQGQCGLREIAFIHPHGRTVWCEIRMTGFQWRNAQHVFVTATDVSTRKGFEEELRRHGDFLDNIINAVPDPIFVTNDQQKLVLANEAYCREFLANRELLAGALWQDGDVSPDEQAGRPEDGFNRFAQEVEHQQTSVDGQVTFHSIRRSLFNDRVSSTPYMVAVSRDITEERRHQARLGLLASVFCNAAEGVAILDLAGTIIEANPKLLEMLALDEKVVDGHSLSSFVKFGTGEERVDWQELLNTSSWSGKVRYAHPDGRLRIFRLSLS
jgi:PAS domain S-box-containing protein